MADVCLEQELGENFALYRGDCVEVLRGIPDGSIDYSLFSPPFASLYTSSASPRDMGNCSSREEFMAHFGFLADQLIRAMKPGRLVSMHCMLLPTSKARDGHIGMVDFRGDLIRAMEARGFIHHSEVVIWKDPVTAMQRTKAHGLLYKTLKKDSTRSRQGIPDFVVTMRTPGANPEPVAHTVSDLSLDLWQRYASPVWTDIDMSDTLQHRSARENDDERHICPLQLGVIRRLLHLWTNPGDVVMSPFAGIGSEGYVSLEMERRFCGVELKQSYYHQAVRNLRSVDGGKQQLGLFEVA